MGSQSPRPGFVLTRDGLVGVYSRVGAKRVAARKNDGRLLAVVCLLVIGVYVYAMHSGGIESLTLNAADTYYNLLVQGFRAGHLSLNKDVPSGLKRLADPYDPSANGLYRSIPTGVHDMSYYKGRLYLYFGVTPALILFWPIVTLTGHYLFHREAVTIFCVIGFLASVGLLRALWRRYFADVRIGVVAACALALGLASGVPILVSGAEVYQVPISCGYMLTMLALGAIWCALHEPERRWKWLAAASVAYGLALGARPTLLFGSVILLVPVAQAWRERRQIWVPLLAAVVPITVIGLGLLLYNAQRFDNPFEFGQRYQLAACQMVPDQFFSLHYLLFNFRVYFLEPVLWSARFPFVHEIASLPLPPGHIGVERGFGILTNIPLACVALAVPWLWRRWSSEADTGLCWFIMAVALFMGIGALTLGFFWAAYFRYEMDFLPALMLLAVVGILGLERGLAPNSEPGLTDQTSWRRAIRWGWVLLLAFSVAFNLLASADQRAKIYNSMGVNLAQAGKMQEAITQYDQALEIEPDYADAHCNLGAALTQVGRVQEAREHLEESQRLAPDSASTHASLGLALEQMGDVQQAMEQFEAALRIRPDFAETHVNLGNVLLKQGRVQEAVAHYEEALRIKPDYVEAHMNLGNGLLTQRKLPEAIAQYEEALRIKPDYPQALDNLGIALAQAGRVPEAMKHWEEALRLKPDDVNAHYNLGNALQGQGRVPEAIEQFEQVLKLRPDFTPAKNALTRLREGK